MYFAYWWQTHCYALKQLCYTHHLIRVSILACFNAYFKLVRHFYSDEVQFMYGLQHMVAMPTF